MANKWLTRILGCLVITLLLNFPESSFAQVKVDAEILYCQTQGLLTGNIGTLIGFVVALVGFFILIVQGSKAGIIAIILGLMVTASPGFLESFVEGLSNAFNKSGNTNKQSSVGTMKCDYSGNTKISKTKTIPDYSTPRKGVVHCSEGRKCNPNKSLEDSYDNIFNPPPKH